MAEKKPKRKPQIKVVKKGPYVVTGLKHLKNWKGENLPMKETTSLCRCGASKNKPYCDGSHVKIGFVGDKDPNRVPGEMHEYVGKGITIVDNTDVCCRDRSCVINLPEVFENENPDAASVDEVIATIKKCPSGALSYKLGGEHCQDYGRKPEITVSKNGPLKVVGGIELKDDYGTQPWCKEHYTLCRCGASKNKPFCDGTHLDIGFKDE